jgi:hypothetical protein
VQEEDIMVYTENYWVLEDRRRKIKGSNRGGIIDQSIVYWLL